MKRRAALLLSIAVGSAATLHASTPRRSVLEVMGAAAAAGKPWAHFWMGSKKNRPTSIPQFAAAPHPGGDPAFVSALSSLPEKIDQTKIGLIAPPARGADEASQGDSVCVLFSGFTVATCLSTANWDGAHRSQKMLEEFALPLLRSLAARLPAVGCLGVGLSYGTADLSKPGAKLAPEAEYLGIVARAADLKALEGGRIENAELVRRSELFARHVGSESVRKIELPRP